MVFRNMSMNHKSLGKAKPVVLVTFVLWPFTYAGLCDAVPPPLSLVNVLWFPHAAKELHFGALIGKSEIFIAGRQQF